MIRTPYHPHSLGDGSKCRRGKGLKTIFLGLTRTSEPLVHKECHQLPKPHMGAPHVLLAEGTSYPACSTPLSQTSTHCGTLVGRPTNTQQQPKNLKTSWAKDLNSRRYIVVRASLTTRPTSNYWSIMPHKLQGNLQPCCPKSYKFTNLFQNKKVHEFKKAYENWKRFINLKQFTNFGKLNEFKKVH